MNVNATLPERQIPYPATVFDSDARFLLLVIREIYSHENDPSSMLEYLKTYGTEIDATLRMLKYLGLAEETRSAFGWKATDVFLQLVARKATRLLRRSPTIMSASDNLTLEYIIAKAWPRMSEQTQKEVKPFAAQILRGLGLMRRTADLGSKPTMLLFDLATDQYIQCPRITFDEP
jgi:hypothetical protein